MTIWFRLCELFYGLSDFGLQRKERSYAGERSGGDLAFEAWGPAAGDCGGAFGQWPSALRRSV